MDRYISLRSSALALLFVTTILTARGWSQQRFRLVLPGSAIESKAELTNQSLLVIDGAGNRTVYRRAPRYDAADGRWTAYHNLALGQVIRWPRGNAGPFLIGTIAADATLVFRASQMQVVALAGRPPVGRPPGGGPALLPAPRTIAGDYRLASVESAPLSVVLDVDRRRAVMFRSGRTPDRIWSIHGVGRGCYRIHTVFSGTAVSLTSLPGSPSVHVAPVAHSTSQLWMIYPHAADGSLLIENAAVPGRVLAGGRDGLVALEKISNAQAQRWRLLEHRPAAGYRPGIKVVSHENRPKPELLPANVEFRNGHQNELWVLVQDRRPGGPRHRVKIPARGAVRMALDRDPGSTLVEVFELLTPGGLYERREYVTELPPVSYYDVSVYERMLQSIAIDRTGKSPSPIEDVNFQPKSVGWFILPPGDSLTDSTLDVYAEAKAAKNPGGVRRLELEYWGTAQPKPDPLKQILEQVRRRDRKR